MEKEHRQIGYARVSTEDQKLEQQRKALISYGVKPEHIFEEHASGGNMNRPALTRAMRTMRDGDSLVVTSLDRLGRTLLGVIETVNMMESEGVNIVSLREKIDTSSAMGKAFFRIALVFAELERDLISERTKAGMAVRKAMGVRFGRSHSIKDNQARLDAIRPYVEDGSIDTMTPSDALVIFNAPEINAANITSPETFRRWRREGCQGID